jgi:hypothetical protein
VPRNRAEQCFDNLSIICFNYDRSIQHYLPFVVAMAFRSSSAMLTKAQVGRP